MSGRRAVVRTTIGVIGGGPSGLMIANLLQRRGIDCVVFDKLTRGQAYERARAGFIEWRNKLLLERSGLGGRMVAEGVGHGRCEFRSPEGSFVLDYGELSGGREHWVYPQHELVDDLAGSFLAGGGDLREGYECVAVLDHERPAALFRNVITGEELELGCEILAGCDGFHGQVRASIPAGVLGESSLHYPFQWLAVLVAAPASSAHVIYAQHPDGYAAHMMRSASISRYYLQTPVGSTVDEWPADRIWSELRTRLALDGFRIDEGPVLERSMLTLRSVVFDPMQFHRTLLVGDAAHIITPCGGKGMNLALQDAVAFVDVAARALAGEPDALAGYTAERLPDVWRSQEFSHWLLHAVSTYPDSDESRFLQELQRTRLHNLEHVPELAEYFSRAYVGME